MCIVPHSTLYPLDIPRRCFHPKCIHGTTLGQVCYVGSKRRSLYMILNCTKTVQRAKEDKVSCHASFQLVHYDFFQQITMVPQLSYSKTSDRQGNSYRRQLLSLSGNNCYYSKHTKCAQLHFSGWK